MNLMIWIYVALACAACLALAPASRWRNVGFVLGSWAAAVLVWITSVGILATGATYTASPGPLAILPGFSFAVDPARAFFLIIGSGVYAVSVPFLVHDAQRRTTGRQILVLGFATVLFASLLTVLFAAGVTSLLFAWEAMSLSLSALVFIGRGTRIEIRAGLVTLGLSEAGALAALAGLLILASAAGTLSLAGIASAASRLPSGVVWAGFLLTFFGFGVKTAIVPVNGWMPNGYAAAPRGILPLFSGATLNLGVFTLWVVDGPLAVHALWPALVVLSTGAITAILGISYALTETNLTRVLTRSSIENLGFCVAGLGAGFAFTALHHPAIGGIAMIAGLFHMLNHSTYKTLLFLGAGGIGNAVGHDDLDRLGGLLRRLPLFGTVFVLGCVAIAGLPPLNGFVSDYLTLQSLLRVIEIGAVPVRIVFALAGALLALTGGLAVTCFAMVATGALLGVPRSTAARRVHRIAPSATRAMTLLILICVGLSVWATGVIPVLGQVTAPLAGIDASPRLVPNFFGQPTVLATKVAHGLTQLGAQLGRGVLPLHGLIMMDTSGTPATAAYAMSTAWTFAVLVFLLGLVWLVAHAIRRRRRVRRGIPWNAGITRLQPEMSYTATSFAAPERVMLNAVLDPEVSREDQHQGAFLVSRTHREVHIHIVDRWLINPLLAGAQTVADLVASLHNGKVTGYAGYLLVSLVVAALVATVVSA